MIELTYGAQARLDAYLNELRRVLSGSPSVDTQEVERDVREHIETALAEQPGPVEASTLDRVLHDLGSPDQWLPEEERTSREPRSFADQRREILAALRDIGYQLTAGPESYRFAYFSLFLLSVGWGIFCLGQNDQSLAFAWLLTALAFLFSRASISLYGSQRLSAGQKWLLYPALLFIDLPVAAVLLLAVPFFTGLFFLEHYREINATQTQIQVHEEENRHFEQARKDLRQLSGDAQISFPINATHRHAVFVGTKLELLEIFQRKIEGNDEQIRIAKWNQERRQENLQIWGKPITIPLALGSVIVLTGLNWILVGLLWIFFPTLFRNLFYPFVQNATRIPGIRLITLGGILSIGLLGTVGAFKGIAP